MITEMFEKFFGTILGDLMLTFSAIIFVIIVTAIVATIFNLCDNWLRLN